MAIKLCEHPNNNSDWGGCFTLTTSGSGSIPVNIEKTMDRDFFDIDIPTQFSPLAEDFVSTKTEYKITGVITAVAGGDSIAAQKTIISNLFAPPGGGGNSEGTTDPGGSQPVYYLFSDAPFTEGGGTSASSNGVPVHIKRVRFSGAGEQGPNIINFEIDLFRVSV